MEIFFEQLPATEVGHWDQEHVEIAQEVIELCAPESILEIGFNVGHSALIWLSLSRAALTSVDSGALPNTEEGVRQIGDLFKERFCFIRSDSRHVFEQIKEQRFDLIFVDGGHGYGVCFNDLMLAVHLDIPYILIDDIRYGRVGDAVRDFMKDKEYVTVKEWKIKYGVVLYALKGRIE